MHGAGLVPPARMVGVDVARCLALLGMVATHVLPPVDGTGVTAVQQLAGGRSSALFAVLAGVSIALLSGRREPVHGIARRRVTGGLLVRAVLIAMLGLLLGVLETTIAIILTYYGVLFCLAVPFLRLRARSLAWWAAGWLLVVPLLSPDPPPGRGRPRVRRRPARGARLGDVTDPVGRQRGVAAAAAELPERAPSRAPAAGVARHDTDRHQVLPVGAAYRLARRSGPLERLVARLGARLAKLGGSAAVTPPRAPVPPR